MADLTSADVTYNTGVDSVDRRLVGMPPHYDALVTVSFGDGVDTYPAGGVPLVPNKLGMPSGVLEAVLIVDQADSVDAGVEWFYDDTAKTLRGFSAIGTELTGGATAVDATTLVLKAQGY